MSGRAKVPRKLSARESALVEQYCAAISIIAAVQTNTRGYKPLRIVEGTTPKRGIIIGFKTARVEITPSELLKNREEMLIALLSARLTNLRRAGNRGLAGVPS